MKIVVTGGAGFLGSHLCEFLLARGDQVLCLDNLSTGRLSNIEAFRLNPRFEFIEADACEPFTTSGPVDAVAHLASPASPPDYHRLPLETLAVGSRGTENALQLALAKDARFVLASTSEIYGDPLMHPQREDYWGNVNSIGPRSVYDEAKRYAEAVSFAYRRFHDVNVGVVRIFNTYGPRMRAVDGRVVSSFISQALNGVPLTIYGDGDQTRSFCYVDDLIRGITAMLDGVSSGPINIGNPVEFTIGDFAEMVIAATGSNSPIEYHRIPTDDPVRRRPDISLAQAELGWSPQIDLAEGLGRTIEWFRSRPAETRAAVSTLAGPQFGGQELSILKSA
jgi:dTDP-glucose 4,6-dehydratase